jgi:hypothetical protein
VGIRVEPLLAGDSPGSDSALPVTLWWEADGPSRRDYRVSIQLLPPAGAGSNTPVSQQDGEPTRPTSGWRAGETIEEHHLVAVPDGVELAGHRLGVTMYAPEPRGGRLPAGLLGDAASDPRLSLLDDMAVFTGLFDDL